MTRKKVYKKRPACLATVDLLTTFVVLTVFCLITIFTFSTFSEVADDMAADSDLSNESKSMVSDNITSYPSLFDNLIVLAYVLLCMGLLVSVFMVDTHPVFFVLTVILMIFAFLALMLLANVYDDVLTDVTVSSFANQLPKTIWLMTHLVEVAVAIGFMTLIALYAKQRLFR